MLLCNELHYYTIIHHITDTADFADLGSAAITLLTEANYIIQTEEQFDDRYEIWVKKDNDAYVFLLFPYDLGVVTYGQ